MTVENGYMMLDELTKEFGVTYKDVEEFNRWNDCPSDLAARALERFDMKNPSGKVKADGFTWVTQSASPKSEQAAYERID